MTMWQKCLFWNSAICFLLSYTFTKTKKCLFLEFWQNIMTAQCWVLHRNRTNLRRICSVQRIRQTVRLLCSRGWLVYTRIMLIFSSILLDQYMRMSLYWCMFFYIIGSVHENENKSARQFKKHKGIEFLPQTLIF